MTNEERIELEVCLEVLNSQIADFYIITSKYGIQLSEGNEVWERYKELITYTHGLRSTTSYEDVMEAKEKIRETRRFLEALEDKLKG